MKTIAVVGAGGNGREVAGLIRDLGQYEFVGFLADRAGAHDSPLLGGFDWLQSHAIDCLAMGIGNPQSKLAVGRRLKTQYPQIEWPALVHPTAYVGRTSKLAPGAIVGVGAILTENVQIAAFAQCNFGCAIGHETQVGEGCLINPGANISGGVCLGEGVLVGTGARVLEYLRVGDHAMIGAGAVVTRDVAPHTTVIGVPARPR
ncbi:MAG TPA: NeuD/PglB/VioB family sugar acetyltransferase [Terriglobales bacterium]|jgi:sugar O-acyltransferase (sialic acid O-acetyltransferase NeuD family)|nr:NeuD/PglB/VioB family sugar acetyltransferase [Terriglobales bacterium]